MNLINRMIASESNQKLNIDGTVKICECAECTTSKVENITVKYPPLSEEEIEQIIKERYDYKDEKTKKFIRKALRKHGDRYDYSNVVYVKYNKKIDIICRVEGHKPFPQKPDNHLQGQGCSMCKCVKLSEKFRITKEEFIERARKVHGDKYDYSKVEYMGMNTKVIIICPIHDDFPQTPANHLSGKGCRKCQYEKLANDLKLTLSEFIEMSNKIHGKGTYDYSKVEYINMNTEVTIICPKHGEFPQIPTAHIYGKEGCPKCNKNKGEESIRRFLTEKGIEFEEQKTFEGCKNKRLLRFDFYLPKYNLCIESDGNIHSEKINWDGKKTNEEMEKELKLTQHRDNIKNEFCKKNGIALLRVNNLRAYEELIEYFN